MTNMMLSSMVFFSFAFFHIKSSSALFSPKTDEAEVTHKAFLDIKSGDENIGTIVVGLFGNIAPKSVKNFIALADGTADYSFEGTSFHRVIKDFMIQGGDVLNKAKDDKQKGAGSWSIYGKYYDDEEFTLKHYGPGWLSMANAGKNTNGCQFFISTVETQWLNGLHVVFGKVLDGMSVVRKIENTKTDGEDHPVVPIIISKTRVEELTSPLPVSKEGAEE